MGLGLVAAGVALSFFHGRGMVGRVAWGMVADVPRSGLTVLSGVFGLGLLLLVALPLIRADWPLAGVYGFVTVLGLTVGGWIGVFLGEVLRLAPAGESARAIAGGYVFTFGGGLGALGLFLLGFEVLGGYGGTLWLLVGLAALGVLLSLRAAHLRAKGPRNGPQA